MQESEQRLAPAEGFRHGHPARAIQPFCGDKGELCMFWSCTQALVLKLFVQQWMCIWDSSPPLTLKIIRFFAFHCWLYESPASQSSAQTAVELWYKGSFRIV